MTNFMIVGDVEGDFTLTESVRQHLDDPQFCVQMGDYVQADSKAMCMRQIKDLDNEFKGIGCVIYQVIGNHDLENLSLHEFVQLARNATPSTSFDVGSYHFIILNSADGTIRGSVSEAQIMWLRADLAGTSKNTVVFTHHLVGKYPRQRILELNNSHLIKNYKIIRQVLEESKKVILVIEGHGHYRHNTQNDIDYVCVGHYYTHNSIWNVSINTEKINITEVGINDTMYNTITIPRKRSNAYYASASADLILSNVRKNRSVLNVGCVSHTIAEMDWQRDIGEWLHDRLVSVSSYVLGVDIATEGIAYMQSNGYNAVVMNAEEINIDDKFDYIIAGFVVDHLSNIGKFFAGCNRVIESNGTILITIKNPYAFVYLKHVIKGRMRASDNIGLFTPDLLSNLARRYGFSMTKVEYAVPREFGISKLLFLLGAKQFGGHTCILSFKKDAT